MVEKVVIILLKLSSVLKNIFFLGVLSNQLESVETRVGQEQKCKSLFSSQKKPRRQNVTVTKCVESLNAKLVVLPTVDPFFAKLSNYIGDTEKADRMLTNLLQSKKSSYGSIFKEKFWNSSEQTDEKEVSQSLVSIPSVSLLQRVVRTTLADIRLCDEPLEEFQSITYVTLHSFKTYEL